MRQNPTESRNGNPATGYLLFQEGDMAQSMLRMVMEAAVTCAARDQNVERTALKDW